MSTYRTKLYDKINAETDPLKKIDLENELVFELRDFEGQDSIDKSWKIVERSQNLDNGKPYLKGLGHAYANIGLKKIINGQGQEGYDHLLHSLQLFTEGNIEYGVAFAKILISNYHWGRGEINIAMELAIEVSQKKHLILDPISCGWCHYFLGSFYSDLNNNDLALENFLISKEQFEIAEYDNGLARTFNGLTTVYRKLNKPDEGIKFANLSLNIHKATQSQMGVSRSLNDLGTLYADCLDYPKAIETLNEALNIRLKTNNVQAIITSQTELAEIYLKTNYYSKALNLYQEASELCKKHSAKSKLVRCLLGLIEVYKKLNEFEKALTVYDEVYALKSELLQQDTETRIKSIESKFASESKEKEAEIYRLKNIELKEAYSQIEEKNKDITDSIRYAKRIQEAILPTDNELKKIFNDFFIFYLPKDIVSGDFYWATEKSGIKVIAAVDCTGHGVPGAFMSMIGNSLLNEIVNEKGIFMPGEILKKLSSGVRKVLHQCGENGDSKDGMDIAILTYDTASKKIHFAGANNPLYIINSGKLTEIKGDKKGIGFNFEKDDEFSTYSFDSDSQSRYYILTDGYADQFGGSLGKKLKYQRLKNILLSSAEQTMQQQKFTLETQFLEWKNDLDQIDDVCIVGIKFNQ